MGCNPTRMRTSHLHSALLAGFVVAACGGSTLDPKADVDVPDTYVDVGAPDVVADAPSDTGADGAPTDAASDAKLDGPSAFDSGPIDSGKKDGALTDAAVCPEPADLTGWMPGPQTPPHAAQKVCQSGDYQALFDNCFGPMATAQSCQTWTQAHQQCSSCIMSSQNDPTWGVIVEGNGVARINVAGCLKLVGETACSTAYANQQQCDDAGCWAQCPVTDQQSFQQYQQCITKVNAGACKQYADGAGIACAPDAAPNVDKCQSQGGFSALLVKLGPVFCGP